MKTMNLFISVFVSALVISSCLVPIMTSDVDADAETVFTEDQGTDIETTGGLIGDIQDGWKKFRMMVAVPYFAISDMTAKLGTWLAGIDGAGRGYTGDDPVDAYARSAEIRSTIEKLSIVSQMGEGLVSSDIETWKLSASYLNRLAEISAGNLWYDGSVFDANDILEFAGIYDLLSSGLYNTQYVLDWAFDQAGNRFNMWERVDWGEGITAGFVGKEFSISANERINLNFSAVVQADDGHQRVYLDTMNMADNINSDLSNGVWTFSEGCALKYLDTGLVTNLALGYNNIAELQTGWYSLTPGTYSGPFLPSTAADAAPLTGGVTLIADDKYGYAVADSSDSITVFWDGELHDPVSDLDYYYTADNVTNSTSSASDGEPSCIVSVVYTFRQYFEQLHELLFNSASSAQVMWSITSTAKHTNVLLSPSSVVPQLEGVDVDAIQAYSLYMNALSQTASYYDLYGEVLKAGEVKISAESLDLYCHGSVYNLDGSPLAENVIFTPYVYLHSLAFSSGRYCQFTENSSVVVWDSDVDSAVDWVDTMTDIDPTYIGMNLGSYFVADEIVLHDELVDSAKLNVKTVETVEALKDTSLAMSDTPDLIDVEPVYVLVFILIGIILFLLGGLCFSVSVRRGSKIMSMLGKLFIIVGLTVIVIGMIFPVQFADLVLGWLQ